jgi:hypothetical protein
MRKQAPNLPVQHQPALDCGRATPELAGRGPIKIDNAPSEASGSAPEKPTALALFIRHRRPVCSPQEPLLYALRAALLSGDPFANVWIAIRQRDVRCFAPGQKIDAVLTCQSHIFQVENDAAALRFCGDDCFQLGDMLCVEPAAYRKNHFPVFRPVNSEHSVLPRTTLATEMQVQHQPKVAEIKGVIGFDNLRTSSINEFRKNLS